MLYEGAESGAEREARAELLRYCSEHGASLEQLRAAVREDRLSTLPLEFALTTARTYTLTEVARLAGISPPYLRKALLALGHPNPRPRERAFTEEDLGAARALAVFLKAGLPRDELLEVAGVLGQSLAQVAAAIRRLIGDALLQPGDSEHTLSLRYVGAAELFAPQMAPIVEAQLRSHLREQAVREVIGRAEREAGTLRHTREVAVCFADLTGFTRLGEKASPEDVGALGARMAALCAEAAEPPVNLVKMIGDAGMFVSADVDALLNTVLVLARRAREEAEDTNFPTMRAGVASGAAVLRLGDWFGATVNRASRIVGVAKPQTILADPLTRARSSDAFTWTRSRRRRLKGIDGRTPLYRLEPAAEAAAPEAPRAARSQPRIPAPAVFRRARP